MNNFKYSTSPKDSSLEINSTDVLSGGIFGLMFAALVIIAVLAVAGQLLKFVWNKTLPEIFGIKEITLYQAICLYILANMLLKR